MIYSKKRNKWLAETEQELIRNCTQGAYKSTGPGGQKKDKKKSSIRLVHLPTNICVTSSETRSSKTNLSSAIKKLKFRIAVEVRGPKIEPEMYNNNYRELKYLFWIAALFDALNKYNFKISNSAEDLGLSTSRLIKQIAKDKNLWKLVNEYRERNNLSYLKLPK